MRRIVSLLIFLCAGIVFVPSTSFAATSVDCNDAFDELRAYIESGDDAFYTPKIDAWAEVETPYWPGYSLTTTYHGEIEESGLTVESTNFYSTFLEHYVGMTGSGTSVAENNGYVLDSLTLERHLGDDPQVEFSAPNLATATVTPTSCTRYSDAGIDAVYYMTADDGSQEYTFGFQTVTDDPTPPSYLILQVRDAAGDLVGSRHIPGQSDAADDIGPITVDPYGEYSVNSWAYDSDGMKSLNVTLDSVHSVDDDRITHEEDSRDPPRRLDLEASVNETVPPSGTLTVAATARNFDDVTAQTGRIIIEARTPQPDIHAVNGRDPRHFNITSQPTSNPSDAGTTEELTFEGDYLGGEGVRTRLKFEATENHRIWPARKWRDDQTQWVAVDDPDKDGLNQRVDTVVPEYYKNYTGELLVHVRTYPQQNNPNNVSAKDGFTIQHKRVRIEYSEDTCDTSGKTFYTGSDIETTNTPDDFRVESAPAPTQACGDTVEILSIRNPGNDGCEMEVTLHDSSIDGDDRVAHWDWINPYESIDVSGVYLTDDTYFTLSLDRSDSGCGNTGDFATIEFDWTTN
ncbi:MAG: hypothetical protein ACQEVA_19840 [Myxococcota bacterium]